ncbi:unnamed protein product [Notodromas monacha]|uniref:Ig-like domain-containing protein n=1 Tax=Notodromas monacha TaxID=399045 RepID=A0A7R9GDB7_9CRUS|nr:unnamed protein product [Notodromas monacha]CAG0918518.1 unnamed protein product [Notodromas monacha]
MLHRFYITDGNWKTVHFAERVLTKPILTISPETTTAIVGSNVTLACKAISSTAYIMYWEYEAPVDDKFNTTPKSVPIEVKGANKTLLVLTNVTFEDEGKYSCRAENNYGESVVTAYVKVVPAPEEPNNMLIWIVVGALSTMVVLLLLSCIGIRYRAVRYKRRCNEMVKGLIYEFKRVIVEPQPDSVTPRVYIERVKYSPEEMTLRSEMLLGKANSGNSDVRYSGEYIRFDFAGRQMNSGSFCKTILTKQMESGYETPFSMPLTPPSSCKASSPSYENDDVRGMRHTSGSSGYNSSNGSGHGSISMHLLHHGNRQHQQFDSEMGSSGLTTVELVKFCYQVARGMEYLASKRVSSHYEFKDYQIMSDCWMDDPRERPTFNALVARLDYILSTWAGPNQGYITVMSGDQSDSSASSDAPFRTECSV